MFKSILSSVFLSAGLMVSAMSSVYAFDLEDNMLEPGEFLTNQIVPFSRGTAEQCLSSNNNEYELCMQADGNVTLRDSSGELMWHTNTGNQGGHTFAMQGDGNLVLYNFASQPIWASGSSGKHGAYLVLQDDGNLVVYYQPVNVAWAAGSNPE